MNNDINKIPDKVIDLITKEIFVNNSIEIDSFEAKDGYYIFKCEENSMYHITIKGIKNWLFGLWINKIDDNKYKAAFFGQHIYNIDKFKPTASVYNYEFIIDLSFDDGDILSQDIISFLRKLESNPITMYWNYYCDLSYYNTYINRNKYLFFLSSKINRIKSKLYNLYLKERLINIFYIAKFKLYLLNNVDVSFLDKGKYTSPRFNIKFTVYDEKYISKLYDLIYPENFQDNFLHNTRIYFYLKDTKIYTY